MNHHSAHIPPNNDKLVRLQIREVEHHARATSQFMQLAYHLTGRFGGVAVFGGMPSPKRLRAELEASQSCSVSQWQWSQGETSCNLASTDEAWSIEESAAQEVREFTDSLVQGIADTLRTKQAEVDSLVCDLREACDLSSG